VRTPALLWRSGVGPSDRLRAIGVDVVADNPAVGRGLTDHPGVFLFARPAGDPGPVDPQYQLGVRYSSGIGAPDDMFLSMMNVFDLAYMPDLRAAMGTPTAIVVTCGVHEPRSRGAVTLTSADPLAPPRIELNLLAEPEDTARLVAGLRRCHDVLRSGLAAFTGGTALLGEDDFADDAALSAYVRSVVAPWYHVPDGAGGRRRDRRQRPPRGARGRGAAGRGRVGDAEGLSRAHQPDHHRHRRARRRAHHGTLRTSARPPQRRG
jgi:choline dehydrogenase